MKIQFLKKWGMKATALLIAGLFFWETFACAVPASLHEVLSKSYTVQRDGVQIESSIDKITIPSALGSIQETFSSSESRVPSPALVHIEDAHGEPEAQKNSQAILEHLKKEYGIQTFFLEGAWSKLEPSLLRFSNSVEENQKILSQLIEKGIVGGPESFLWENSQRSEKVQGYGIEDLELYKKNLEQFRAVMSAKPQSDVFLNEMKAGLLTKASQILNSELAEYFRQWSFHEEIESDYSAHLRVLAEKAHAHLGLDLDDAREQYDWPMLVRFQKLKLLESYSAQSAAYSEEKKRFQGWVQSENLISAKQMDLILSQDALGTNYDLRSFFESFYEQASPLGFKFKDYPALSKVWGRQMLAQEMHAPALIQEIKTLENALIEKLAQTADEKKFIEKYREYLLLRKLLCLELSKEEWQRLEARGPGLGPEIEAKIQIARDFYSTAEARDAAMVERTIDWIKKEKIEKAAIITGGFHSRGLGELFKQNSISYVRIQPRIEQMHGKENYLKLMAGRSALRYFSPAEPLLPREMSRELNGALDETTLISSRFEARAQIDAAIEEIEEKGIQQDEVVRTKLESMIAARDALVSEYDKAIQPRLEKHQDIRVGQFNLLVPGSQNDGRRQNTLERFRLIPEALRSQMKEALPHFFTLQETTRIWGTIDNAWELAKALSYEHESYFYKTHDGGNEGGFEEGLAILWHPSFKKIETFSEKLVSDGKQPKIIFGVRLQSSITGEDFYVFTTHLDPFSKEIRKQQIQQAKEFIELKAGADSKVIFAGDLNFEEEKEAESARAILGEVYQDVYAAANPAGSGVTFSKLNPLNPYGVSRRLDFIYSRGMPVKDARLSRDGRQVISDHYPIIADLKNESAEEVAQRSEMRLTKAEVEARFKQVFKDSLPKDASVTFNEAQNGVITVWVDLPYEKEVFKRFVQAPMGSIRKKFEQIGDGLIQEHRDYVYRFESKTYAEGPGGYLRGTFAIQPYATQYSQTPLNPAELRRQFHLNVLVADLDRAVSALRTDVTELDLPRALIGKLNGLSADRRSSDAFGIKQGEEFQLGYLYRLPIEETLQHVFSNEGRSISEEYMKKHMQSWLEQNGLKWFLDRNIYTKLKAAFFSALDELQVQIQPDRKYLRLSAQNIEALKHAAETLNVFGLFEPKLDDFDREELEIPGTILLKDSIGLFEFWVKQQAGESPPALVLMQNPEEWRYVYEHFNRLPVIEHEGRTYKVRENNRAWGRSVELSVEPVLTGKKMQSDLAFQFQVRKFNEAQKHFILQVNHEQKNISAQRQEIAFRVIEKAMRQLGYTVEILAPAQRSEMREHRTVTEKPNAENEKAALPFKAFQNGHEIEATNQYFRIGEYYFIPDDREVPQALFAKLKQGRAIILPDMKRSSDGLMGLKFGSHTVNAVLQMLNRRQDIQDSVFIDLGAGSGVLSLLAIRLGASQVLAVEQDKLVGALLDQAIEANKNLSETEITRNPKPDDIVQFLNSKLKDGFFNQQKKLVFAANLPSDDLKETYFEGIRPILREKRNGFSPIILFSGISNEVVHSLESIVDSLHQTYGFSIQHSRTEINNLTSNGILAYRSDLPINEPRLVTDARSEMRRFDAPLQVSREEFSRMWLEQNSKSLETQTPYGAREWHKDNLLTGAELQADSGVLRVLYHKKLVQSSVYQIWFLAEGSSDWQRIDQEVIGLSTAEDAGFGFNIILNNVSLFVSRLFLRESFRGQRWGRLILNWIRNYAEHKNIRQINFETRVPTVLHLIGEVFDSSEKGEKITFYSDTLGRIDARDYLERLGANVAIAGLKMNLSNWRREEIEIVSAGKISLDARGEALFKTEGGSEYKIKIENGWSMRLWLKEGNDWKEQSFRYPEPVNVVISLSGRSEMRTAALAQKMSKNEIINFIRARDPTRVVPRGFYDAKLVKRISGAEVNLRLDKADVREGQQKNWSLKVSAQALAAQIEKYGAGALQRPVVLVFQDDQNHGTVLHVFDQEEYQEDAAAEPLSSFMFIEGEFKQVHLGVMDLAKYIGINLFDFKKMQPLPRRAQLKPFRNGHIARLSGDGAYELLKNKAVDLTLDVDAKPGDKIYGQLVDDADFGVILQVVTDKGQVLADYARLSFDLDKKQISQRAAGKPMKLDLNALRMIAYAQGFKGVNGQPILPMEFQSSSQVLPDHFMVYAEDSRAATIAAAGRTPDEIPPKLKIPSLLRARSKSPKIIPLSLKGEHYLRVVDPDTEEDLYLLGVNQGNWEPLVDLTAMAQYAAIANDDQQIESTLESTSPESIRHRGLVLGWLIKLVLHPQLFENRRFGILRIKRSLWNQKNISDYFIQLLKNYPKHHAAIYRLMARMIHPFPANQNEVAQNLALFELLRVMPMDDEEFVTDVAAGLFAYTQYEGLEKEKMRQAANHFLKALPDTFKQQPYLAKKEGEKYNFNTAVLELVRRAYHEFSNHSRALQASPEQKGNWPLIRFVTAWGKKNSVTPIFIPNAYLWKDKSRNRYYSPEQARAILRQRTEQGLDNSSTGLRQPMTENGRGGDGTLLNFIKTWNRTHPDQKIELEDRREQPQESMAWLDWWRRHVSQIKKLTPDEQFDLYLQWKTDGDERAYQKLFESYVPLIDELARDAIASDPSKGAEHYYQGLVMAGVDVLNVLLSSKQSSRELSGIKAEIKKEIIVRHKELSEKSGVFSLDEPAWNDEHARETKGDQAVSNFTASASYDFSDWRDGLVSAAMRRDQGLDMPIISYQEKTKIAGELGLAMIGHRFTGNAKDLPFSIYLSGDLSALAPSFKKSAKIQFTVLIDDQDRSKWVALHEQLHNLLVPILRKLSDKYQFIIPEDEPILSILTPIVSLESLKEHDSLQLDLELNGVFVYESKHGVSEHFFEVIQKIFPGGSENFRAYVVDRLEAELLSYGDLFLAEQTKRSEQRTAPDFTRNLVGNGKGLGFLPFLRAWEFLYRGFKAWTVFRKKPWPIQIEGYENLWLDNPDERLILAGNHTGLAENLFFVTELYRLAGRMPFFIAQPEHVDSITRTLIKMGGGLSIEKGKTVAKAEEFLKNNPGAILGVFPAGRPERLQERIKTAAVSAKSDDEIARDFLHWNESAVAKIAVETGASVVPFAIDSNVPRKWGVKELWHAFRLWQKNDPRQPPFYIRVRIGKPISSKDQTPEALMYSVKLAVVGELRKATEEAKFNPTLWLDGYLRKFPEILAAQPASKKWSDFKVVEFFHAQMLKNFSHEPNWAARFVDATALKSPWFQKLSSEHQKLIRLYRTYLKLHHDDLNYFESLFNISVSRRHFMSLLSGVFVTATASGLTQMPAIASQQAVPSSFYRGLGGMARTIAAEQSRVIAFGQSTVFEWATEHLGLNDAFERWGKQNSGLMEQLWSMVRKEEKRIADNDVLVQARVYEILSSVLSGSDMGRSYAVMELPAYERLRGRIFESAESLLERLNHGVEIFKSFSPQARRGIMLQLGKSPSVGPGMSSAEAQRQRINKTKTELQQKLQKKQAQFYTLIDSIARYVFESANPDAAVRIKLEKAIADYEAEIIRLKKQIDGDLRDLADQEASLEVSQKILAQIQPYLHAYRERTLFAARSELRAQNLEQGLTMLDDLVRDRLQNQAKPFVIVNLFGGAAMGTSTIGKIIAKRGVAGLPPEKVKVLEGDDFYDENLSTPFPITWDQRLKPFDYVDALDDAQEQGVRVVVVTGIFSEFLSREVINRKNAPMLAELQGDLDHRLIVELEVQTDVQATRLYARGQTEALGFFVGSRMFEIKADSQLYQPDLVIENSAPLTEAHRAFLNRSEMRVFNGYDGVADEVVKVAREKQARKKGTGVLLGLGGPSGVGKGFFSKIISGALTQQGYDVHSLEIDGFLKLDAEEVKLQQRAAAQGKIHDTEWDFWDEEEAFDVLWMVHDFLNMSFEPPTHPLLLDKIKAAGNPDNIDVIEIVIPQAWHRTQKDGSNRYEDKWVLHRDSVVILDGKYIARFEKKFREIKSKRLSDALIVLEDDSDATREKYVHRVYEKYAHQLRSDSYLLDEKLNIFDNALVPSYQRYENETRDVWDYLINVRGLYRPEISEDYPQPIFFEDQDVINPKKLDENVAADLRIFSDFVLGYYPEHYQRVKKALNEKRLLAMVGYEKLPTAAQVMGEILAELHMAMRDHSANPHKLQTLFQFNTPTAINFPDLKAAMSVYLEGRAMPVHELERILDNKDDEQRGKLDRNVAYQLLIAPKLMQYLIYLAKSTQELKTFAYYRDRAVNAWSNLEREALASLKADGFEMSGGFVGLAYKEKLIQNAMNIILGNYSSVQYQDGESAARSEMRMPKAGRDSLAALRFFYREVLRLHLDMTRASYRSTEEDEQKQAVYDEVAVDLKELQRLLQGHPQLRRQLASRIKSAVNMLAERGTKRNPVAAGTALTQAIEDILNKLYEPRVKKQGRRHRDSLASRKIVNLKNGMWILKQGVYRNVKVGKRGSVAMTQKQDKQFSSLWELARSLDHQLEKMTSELTRARETLVALNDIQDFLEHSAGELPPDLSARLGKTLKTMQAQWVIEKQLAAQALQFAVELEHQEVRSRVARFAEYASWLIKMRADELEGMIASVQRLREKDLNSEVSSRNYNFARSLRSLRSMLERYFGTTGVTWRSAREPRPVQAKVAGIIRDLEKVREPDYEGILALMRGIQSGFGQSLQAANPETESRLLRYVEVALGLVEFSGVRQNALFEFEKRKREIGSKSEEMDEDAIFQTVFQDLINQRKLNDRTQWSSAWFDLYAFAREPIHLTVQKERVPNPRFEALRVLSQILGAKSLQDALNRKKVKAVPGLVAKIKELGGSDLNQSVLNLPGEARKQLFEFIQTTFQLEKKLPLLPAQYRARSEVRRPDPWEATGLWKAVDLKQKIQEAKQPGQYVNQYRLSASLKALSESEWKDLEEWAGQEDSIDLAALNRMKQNDAKYSPVLELGEDLIEQRREMPLFFGMARMIRQSWTDKNEELWMKVLKIGSKHQFKAHGTLNNAIKEHGSLVANLGVLQLHAAMLGIMIDGKISRGDLGEFGFSQYDDFAPLNAADYGPYYVLMHPDYRKADFEYRGGWHDTNEEVVSRNDHLIYLIPEEGARPYFIQGLKKSVEYGFMSERDAKTAEDKIMTYEEFIAADEKMKEILSKEKTPAEVIHLAMRSETRMKAQDELAQRRSTAPLLQPKKSGNAIKIETGSAVDSLRSEVRYFEGTKHRQFISENGFARAYSVPEEKLTEVLQSAIETLPSHDLFEELIWIGKRKSDSSWDLAIGFRRSSGQDYPSHAALADHAFGLKRQEVASGVLKFAMNRGRAYEVQILTSPNRTHPSQQREELMLWWGVVAQISNDINQAIQIRDESMAHALFSKAVLNRVKKQDKAGKYYLLTDLLEELERQKRVDDEKTMKIESISLAASTDGVSLISDAEASSLAWLVIYNSARDHFLKSAFKKIDSTHPLIIFVSSEDLKTNLLRWFAENKPAQKLFIYVSGKTISSWARDRVLPIVTPQGPKIILPKLRPSSQDGPRGAALEATRAYFESAGVPVAQSRVIFEGGNILFNGETAFFGANLIEQNQVHNGWTAEQTKKEIAKVLGGARQIYSVTDPFNFHLDMFMTLLPERKIVIGDPALGLAALENDTNQGRVANLYSWHQDDLDTEQRVNLRITRQLTRKYQPRVEALISNLEKLGFDVVRVPLVLGREANQGQSVFPLVTYNNALIEGRRVLMPWYALEADLSAKQAFEKLGYAVEPLENANAAMVDIGCARCMFQKIGLQGRDETVIPQLEQAARSEVRVDIIQPVSHEMRKAVAEANQNIFSIEFVASMTRSEFRTFFDSVFPGLAADRQKRLRDTALSKAGVSLSINEGLIVGADLAETEGFWEAAKILFSGQKIAILGDGQSPLDNVRFFNDIPSAKQWVNAKKIVAWVSPEEALEHAELRKEVFDWVIMNEQRLAKLYSALGLEAFAQKLMISREFLRAA